MSGVGRRADALARIADGSFDVLVVGGGIVGAGVLLDATLRGYRAALVERDDFASGTSSRSSKLIHGGLRYFARGEIGIVRDSLRERAHLVATAPTLVRPMRHIFPMRTRSAALIARTTLTGYDLLGSRPRHRVMTAREIASDAQLATIAPSGAIEYWEAQADDTRLVFATLAAAVGRGAVAVNHVSAVARRDGAVQLRDGVDGRGLDVETRAVVFAVGAWLGDARAEFDWSSLRLRPAKGIHVVLRVRPRDANVLMRARDGRYLNCMPWHEHVLAGTTDTPATRDEIDDPRAGADDIAYVLDAVRPLYPDAAGSVRAVWAGVRPLVDTRARTTARLSREDQIVPMGRGAFAVAGGKMTTFQAMARRAVDAVDAYLGQKRSAPPVTLTDPLPQTGVRLAPDVPFTWDQLETAARDGMVETLDDLLTQRVGITLVAPDLVRAQADAFAQRIAPIVGWDEARIAREATETRARAKRFIPALD